MAELTELTAIMQITNWKPDGRTMARFLSAPSELLTGSKYFQSSKFSKIPFKSAEEAEYNEWGLVLATFLYDEKAGKKKLKEATKCMQNVVHLHRNKYGVETYRDYEPQETEEIPLDDLVVPDTRPEIDANPVWIDSVFVPKETHMAFQSARNQARKHGKTIVLEIGPSGCGKTTIPKALAEKWDMRFFKFDCSVVDGPQSWFGRMTLKDGNTEFVENGLGKALSQGNTIVILDEINRVEPEFANTLFPIFDFNGEITVNGKQYRVGENTIIACTANIGGRYTGTYHLDQALTNRMSVPVVMDYLPGNQEVKIILMRLELLEEEAKKVVAAMKKLRNHESLSEEGVDLSTRMSLKIAKMVESGLTLRDSLMFSLEPLFDESLHKELIDEINHVMGESRDYETDEDDE